MRQEFLGSRYNVLECPRVQQQCHLDCVTLPALVGKHNQIPAVSHFNLKEVQM